mgnify:FL=1
MADALSVRAFAKVLGVSHVAVLKAIERGRLRHSVRVNPLGKTEIHDVDLARQEWEANAGKVPKSVLPAAAAPAGQMVVTPPVTTVTASAPAAAPPVAPYIDTPLFADSLSKAQLLSALELARQRRLANQLKEGQLLPAAAVTKLRFEAERTLRENMLNIPSRIAGQLAAETDVARVYIMLDEAIREALATTGAEYRAAAARERSPEEPVVHG